MSPLTEDAAKAILPARMERSKGLFAWGFPRLRVHELVVAWTEFLFLFIALPMVAISLGAPLPAYPAIAAGIVAAATLLSSTRAFHWRDLLPVDFASEWRVLVTGTIGVSAFAATITLATTPARFLAPSAESIQLALLYPLCLAAPFELVYRALFFRRYGHLFQSAFWAVTISALSTGMIYALIFGGLPGMAIGAVIGAGMGIAYLRTGSFLLSCLLHTAAGIALLLIGPGQSLMI
ncbi:MAG: type II CAAX prenyl endopeptidase Rce1 family protein [Pikeienuella sp.]